DICYCLYMRNFFRDGIFYYDIAEVKNVEKIKALFHESDLYAAVEENKKANELKDDRRILVVFDNADKAIKYIDNQLFLFLQSFNKDKTLIHYVLISNKPIENGHIVESM